MDARHALIVLAATLAVDALRSSVNSERMSISLGDWDEGLDNLEMIPRSGNRPPASEKLERFHDFVKKSKVMKHPWEKLFIKSSEYRKSEQSYQKMIQDTIDKMKEFNGKRQSNEGSNLVQLIELMSPPYKRQLSGDVDEDDDDEDDDEEEQTEEMELSSSDQDELRRQYEAQIASDGGVFKYSDRGKPEESAREAFQKIFDLGVPEDCSNVTGFGLQYVECLIKLFRTQEVTVEETVIDFGKIFLIWGIIYACIAVPLWCIKGWGCCCITWKYCRPHKIVSEVEKYITENPPGVYVNEEGEEEHYAPSLREKDLYNKISRKMFQA